MHKEKKGFILYKDSYETIQKLTVEEKAELLTSMFDYAITGETKELSRSVDLVFSFMKRQFDRDNDKYNVTCERNRQNILKRWNKEDTTVYDRIQTVPEIPIIDKDNRQKIIDKDKDITTTNSGFDFYIKNINPLITPYEADLVKDLINTYTEEWFISACQVAVANNARKVKFIEAVLKNSKKTGGVVQGTKEQAEAERRRNLRKIAEEYEKTLKEKENE